MTDRTCSIEGCDEVHVARGWCEKHYRRWRKHGDPLCSGATLYDHPGICAITGCSTPYFAKGYCEPHYRRLLKYGDPLGGPPAGERCKPAECTVPGCSRPYLRRGCCLVHLERLKRLGSLFSDPPRRISCLLCDQGIKDPGGTLSHAGRVTSLGNAVIRKHRAHVNDPAWWLARAEWWGNEVAVLAALAVSA